MGKVIENRGIGLWGWMFIILFILKVNPGGYLTTAVAGWSWWVITAPLWIPLLIIGIVFIVVFIGALLGGDNYGDE